MTVLRSLTFSLLFYLWTGIAALALVPTLALPRRVLVRGQTLWVFGILALLDHVARIGVEVRGVAHLPDGPAIIASKHQSAWDTLIYHVVVKDPALVMKRELLLIPLYGWYCRKSAMIPVDRRGGVGALKVLLAAVQRALSERRPVVIFPEGTRSAVGQRLDYQPGVAALYKKLGVPIVPVAVNSGLFWPRRRMVRGPGTITLAFQPPIAPGLERAAFMAELRDRIESASDQLLAEAKGEPLPHGPADRAETTDGRGGKLRSFAD